MSTGRRGWLFSAATAAAVGLAGRSAGPAPVPRRDPATPSPAQPIGDAGVGPGEDLMREHGVLSRILLVYEEAARRIDAREPAPGEAVGSAAALVRRFVEDYHERLEEEHLFPRFERAGRAAGLVATLRAQHEAGRRLTAEIEKLAREVGRSPAAGPGLAGNLRLFVRMYRPHAAREDTVLFPGFRELVSRAEYERLGDDFEARETKVLGDHGFERVVAEVAELEKALGIAELDAFTPRG